MRARLVAGIAIAWLAAASPAIAADRTVDRGIVQSVTPTVLVLRVASGRTRIATSSGTLVRRRGRLAALRILRVGMRVEVVRAADGSAKVVRVLRARA